jgi:hypothetical protein
MVSQLSLPSTKSPCPTCGPNLVPLAYARAIDVRAYKPEYHHLNRDLMLAGYRQDALKMFERVMDYDRVCAWARTTPRALVGRGQRREDHPFRHYLNDMFPAHEGWHARWAVFSSACEALRGYPHLPHHGKVSLFVNVAIQPTEVTFTFYTPLPAWTQRVMAQLDALPFNCKITREYFLTLLRSMRTDTKRR